jgi:CO/xanthine dehydrogenase FAD-binding subunit
VKLPPLRYARPESVAEACAALSDEDAKVIAGGQSLMPLLAIRLASPSVLVDLNRIPGLSFIKEAGNYLHIGAMATHEQMITSDLVQSKAPFLVEAGRHIAHAQIRSRGTIGGSLAHGDNAGEWPLSLLTLGGLVEVESARGRRSIDADELFVGPYMTTLQPGEILTDIWIDASSTSWSFQEAARRAGDYGLALVGASLTISQGRCTAARITVGAAAGTVQRVTASEEALTESPLNIDTARAAAAAGAASLSYIHDMHGSAHYRRRLVTGLLERAILQAGDRR